MLYTMEIKGSSGELTSVEIKKDLGNGLVITPSLVKRGYTLTHKGSTKGVFTYYEVLKLSDLVKIGKEVGELVDWNLPEAEITAQWEKLTKEIRPIFEKYVPF